MQFHCPIDSSKWLKATNGSFAGIQLLYGDKGVVTKYLMRVGLGKDAKLVKYVFETMQQALLKSPYNMYLLGKAFSHSIRGERYANPEINFLYYFYHILIESLGGNISDLEIEFNEVSGRVFLGDFYQSLPAYYAVSLPDACIR